MTTSVIDLTMSQHVSTTVQAPLLTSTVTVTAITTTIPPTPQTQQSTTDPILVRRIGELEQHMADLLQDNLALGERLDKHGTRLYNLEKRYSPQGASGAPGTLEASGSSQLPPPLPPPPTGASRLALQQGSKAPSSSMAMASTLESMAWTTSDIRYESTGVSTD
ncbi:hypothetical protein Tco_0651603 [Tanacetum coccineum]|uniref:Uncharacterized protein n=1 Tax=Tanacetum coccineum TaxID=301880 RepID=A0ABQ4WV84_9ASTR